MHFREANLVEKLSNRTILPRKPFCIKPLSCPPVLAYSSLSKQMVVGFFLANQACKGHIQARCRPGAPSPARTTDVFDSIRNERNRARSRPENLIAILVARKEPDVVHWLPWKHRAGLQPSGADR